MPRKERTLARACELRGIGLHEGLPVLARLLPAPEGSGIRFRRVDLPGSPEVAASLSQVVDGERRTRLKDAEAEVHTVEHLLAALYGLQTDNLLIELNGPELPGLDGSALPWVEELLRAGVVEQRATRRELRIRAPVSVEVGGATLAALPSERDGLELSYTLDYRAQGLAPQYVEACFPGTDLRRDLAPARTFVFAAEAAALRAAGLGRGASAQNTVILGMDGRPSEGALRFADEPALHKLLDLLGDLSLLGGDLHGRVVAIKSGHRAHHELSRRLLAGWQEAAEPALDIRQIAAALPHRYPFLLVDRVLSLEGAKRAVGLKNVTANEPFFMGHFPGAPVMPGVLILEALAQLAGTLLLRTMDTTGKLPMLWAIEKAKLRRTVVPGDQLLLEVDVIKARASTAKVQGVARVGGQVAAEAVMTFTLSEAS
ncbi:MAG: UDP-3-O-acyl-N-acetylglucosamine deacetylase [Planctomycetota bacterium]